jgi:hypothetical protein
MEIPMKKLVWISLALALATGRAEAIEHGSKGFEFRSGDGRYLLQIDSRMQFRLSHPSEDNPVTLEPEPDHTTFDLRRARLKVGGHAGLEWLQYYWEFDFPSSSILDFRATMQWKEWFGVRVGQWKARYTRERVISSGKQQMVDRSLINRPFTIDRQQGVSILGTLGSGEWYNLDYWASAFTGTGRVGGPNDDENLMYLVRLQWNPLGQKVAFAGSDLSRSDAALSVTLAGVTNRSPYTRFSGSGGGQLPGFEDGSVGQYRVNQGMFETAFVKSGFAWQQELHYKEVDDRETGRLTVMQGNYLQLGYFFSEVVELVPPELEFALRHAWFDPGRGSSTDDQYEFSLVANWFFNGHRNKLTASSTWLDYEVDAGTTREEWRVQLQWDVSL